METNRRSLSHSSIHHIYLAPTVGRHSSRCFVNKETKSLPPPSLVRRGPGKPMKGWGRTWLVQGQQSLGGEFWSKFGLSVSHLGWKGQAAIAAASLGHLVRAVLEDCDLRGGSVQPRWTLKDLRAGDYLAMALLKDLSGKRVWLVQALCLPHGLSSAKT